MDHLADFALWEAGGTAPEPVTDRLAQAPIAPSLRIARMIDNTLTLRHETGDGPPAEFVSGLLCAYGLVVGVTDPHDAYDAAMKEVADAPQRRPGSAPETDPS